MVSQTAIQYWARLLLTIILSCCVLQSAKSQTPAQSNRNSAQQPSPKASPGASPGVPTIATPQVAAEAMELNQRLRTLSDRVFADQSLEQLQQQINSLEETTR